jgi:hypothetical protein
MTAGAEHTIPPLARVGLKEEAARRQGLAFKVNQGDTSSWYSARHVAEPASGYIRFCWKRRRTSSWPLTCWSRSRRTRERVRFGDLSRHSF